MTDEEELLRELDSKPEGDDDDDGSQDPDFVIKIGDMTSSTLEGFEEYCPALAHRYAIGRKISSESTGNFVNSGSIKGSYLKVVVSAASIKSGVGVALMKGTSIPEIELVRLVVVDGAKKDIRRIKFVKCQIVIMANKDDLCGLGFKYSSLTVTNIQYDQEGNKQGADAFEQNFEGGTGGEASPES